MKALGYLFVSIMYLFIASYSIQHIDCDIEVLLCIIVYGAGCFYVYMFILETIDIIK